MADEPNAAPEGAAPEQLDLDVLTPEEQVYKDTRGGEKESKPEADAKPEASETAEKPAKDDRKVEYGALAEERNRRKEADERARKAELLAARMEERFRAYTQPQQPQPQKPPTTDEDIFGNVNHLNDVRIPQIEAKISAYERQLATERQMAELGQWAQGTEVEFKKTHPDYDDALKHLRETRTAELRDMGVPDHIIARKMHNDEMSLVAQARRAGRNPAEWAYNVAKRRGYAAKPPAEDVSAKLDRIEAGQKASSTLSNVGGQAGGGEITLKMLVDMPQDDFEAWTAKNPAKFRRLKGSPN